MRSCFSDKPRAIVQILFPFPRSDVWVVTETTKRAIISQRALPPSFLPSLNLLRLDRLWAFALSFIYPCNHMNRQHAVTFRQWNVPDEGAIEVGNTHGLS